MSKTNGSKSPAKEKKSKPAQLLEPNPPGVEQPHWAGREMTEEEIQEAHDRLEGIRTRAQMAPSHMDPQLDVQNGADGHPRAPGATPARAPRGRVPVAVHPEGLGKRGLDRSALPAHKILTHWTRLLAWCNEQVLSEHTSIPRPAIKNLAWRLADRLVEQHGDRLVEWMEGKG